MNTAGSRSKSRPSKAITILVIEDNADDQVIIQRAAAKAFEAAKLVFIDGAQPALTHLEECLIDGLNFPQLILLDLYIPQPEDGWRLLAQVRAQPAPTKVVPIIILSRSEDPYDIRTSYDQGANSYLVKPFTLEQWEECFHILKEYWLGTAHLPKRGDFW